MHSMGGWFLMDGQTSGLVGDGQVLPAGSVLERDEDVRVAVGSQDPSQRQAALRRFRPVFR